VSFIEIVGFVFPKMSFILLSLSEYVNVIRIKNKNHQRICYDIFDEHDVHHHHDLASLSVIIFMIICKSCNSHCNYNLINMMITMIIIIKH
jgi:hypothetical protein